MMCDDWGCAPPLAPKPKTIEDYKEESKVLENQLREQSARLMQQMLRRVHLWSGPFVIVEQEGNHIDVEQILYDKKGLSYEFHFVKRKARRWKLTDTLANFFRRGEEIEPFEHEGDRWRVLSENRVVIRSHLVDQNTFHNKSSEWKNEASYAGVVEKNKSLLLKLERHEYWP